MYEYFIFIPVYEIRHSPSCFKSIYRAGGGPIHKYTPSSQQYHTAARISTSGNKKQRKSSIEAGFFLMEVLFQLNP